MNNRFLIHIKTTTFETNGMLKFSRLSYIWFLLILSFYLSACENIGDEIIEQARFDYKVLNVSAPSFFTYYASDSLLTTTIQLDNSNSISAVWIRIKSQDGKIIVSSRTDLFDDGNVLKNGDTKSGDNIFSAKVGISKKFSSGKYIIEYYLEDKIRKSPENITSVASHNFTYDNNQISYPPIISDLVIPASVNRGEVFVFSVKVSDQNSLADILHVYFKLYRPDGSLVDPQNGLGYFLMVDDGNNEVFGDQVAGDGIYSFKNSFGTSSQTGKWKFEFQAKDRSNKTSNILVHEMIVN